jgi:hypothetical protein
MPNPPYSPGISPCNFWIFGVVKKILRDREFSSSDEIDDAIAQVWDDIIFGDVQSAFRNWTWCPVWVAENDEDSISEQNGIHFLMLTAY